MISQPAPRDAGLDRERAGLVFGPRLAPAGGLEIAGVDLSRALSSAIEEEIRSAFRRHHVLVFRNQALTREQQYAFAASLGEVESHGAGSAPGKRPRVAHIISNLDAAGRPIDRSASPVSNYRWHTDKPYYSAPPMLTMLHAVELPPRGGDTELANTALGYAALPAATRRRIDGLRVVFRWGAGRLGEGAAAAIATRERGPIDHPLVRTHPETGVKALYLGNHASHILDMDEAQGRALLDELLAHTTQPRFVYTHRWRHGDLVMWDNRCLLHRAVANYDTARDRRILHRSVVRGTVPF
jgi:alpha-ketoglutarate-dependent taurine dioxygenase